MKKAAHYIILELNKPVIMSTMKCRPHILNDLDRCTKLITDESVDLDDLSKETGIAKDILENYRKDPDLLKHASHDEIERFRFMMIKIIGAYLKENKGTAVAYDPAYELYRMCQEGDWHGLAKMEEVWRVMYASHE
ncbi:MAG: hypothetical protein SOI51_01915 [Lactobacillus amylovorus]|jgi:hypothetical protein